jgi:AbrB family looped-hinge helix DNA binding protein
MRQQTIRVADRGYVVIPARIRRRLKITKGTRLLLTESDDALILKPVPSFTEGLAGLTGTSFGSTGEQVQAWLDRERGER